jgi:hypothetical protein
MPHTHFLLTTFLLAACALAGIAQAETSGLKVLAYENLPQNALVRGRDSAGERKSELARTPARLEFDAFGRRFAIDLVENERLAQLARSADVEVYRGTLAHEPGSWARITFLPTGLNGLLAADNEIYVIAPAADIETALVTPPTTLESSVIFRLRDTVLGSPALLCAAAVFDGSAALRGDLAWTALVTELDSNPVAAASLAAGVAVEVALIADAPASQRAGSTETRNAMIGRLNNVDGIFSTQVGLEIRIGSLTVETGTDDSFSTTRDPIELLEELASLRARSTLLRASGLTHLLTGRNLASATDQSAETVGVAYVDSVCDARRAVGITEMRGRPLIYESLVMAHEIGHNLGAPHDAEAGSPCAAVPDDFLMAPAINGSDRFSNCSIAQMQPRIANAACIHAIPPQDLVAIADAAERRIALDRTISVRFTVTNAGGSQAIAARALLALEGPGLEFRTASADAGSCSVATNRVSCELGDLARDASRSVTVGVLAQALGAGRVLLTVESADANEDAANNSAATALTVEEAVDLAVSHQGDTQVLTHEPFDATFEIANRATRMATELRIEAQLPMGLSARTATMSGATCTVSQATVSCVSEALDGGSSMTLALELSASSTAVFPLAVTAASRELDANPADNELVVRIQAQGPANAAAIQSAGGGGGRLDPALLIGLLSVGFLRAVRISCPGRRSRRSSG